MGTWLRMLDWAIDGGNVCLEAIERAGARQEKFWNVTFDNNLIAM